MFLFGVKPISFDVQGILEFMDLPMSVQLMPCCSAGLLKCALALVDFLCMVRVSSAASIFVTVVISTKPSGEGQASVVNTYR